MIVDKLLFGTLGGRMKKEPVENFTLVVRDLLEHAPHALPNRGAFCLRSEPTTLVDYPSKNAFFEEITWILWKRQTGK